MIEYIGSQTSIQLGNGAELVNAINDSLVNTSDPVFSSAAIDPENENIIICGIPNSEYTMKWKFRNSISSKGYAITLPNASGEDRPQPSDMTYGWFTGYFKCGKSAIFFFSNYPDQYFSNLNKIGGVVIISKNNTGAPIVVEFTDGTPVAPIVAAADDAEPGMWRTASFSTWDKDTAILLPMVSSPSPTLDSHCDDIFYATGSTLTSYRVLFVPVIVNNVRYLWNGCIAVRDGEVES